MQAWEHTLAALHETRLRRRIWDMLYEMSHYHLMERQRLLLGAIRRHEKGYDPDQPRDDHGRWTDGGDSDVPSAPIISAPSHLDDADSYQAQDMGFHDVLNRASEMFK